jgi:hypothetical protein
MTTVANSPKTSNDNWEVYPSRSSKETEAATHAFINLLTQFVDNETNCPTDVEHQLNISFKAALICCAPLQILNLLKHALENRRFPERSEICAQLFKQVIVKIKEISAVEAQLAFEYAKEKKVWEDYPVIQQEVQQLLARDSEGIFRIDLSDFSD